MTWTKFTVVRGFMARNPLGIAFGLSLAVHLALFGGWRLGKQLGWWEHQATWLVDWKKKLRPKALPPGMNQAPAVAPAPPQIPLTVVAADPSGAVPGPPKNSKFY